MRHERTHQSAEYNSKPNVATPWPSGKVVNHWLRLDKKSAAPPSAGRPANCHVAIVSKASVNKIMPHRGPSECPVAGPETIG